MYVEYFLKYNILYATRLYIIAYMISISTLRKYVREKKRKKIWNPHLYRVVPPPSTNAPLPRRRGEGTFVPG
jgi:hypothetical protein